MKRQPRAAKPWQLEDPTFVANALEAPLARVEMRRAVMTLEQARLWHSGPRM